MSGVREDRAQVSFEQRRDTDTGTADPPSILCWIEWGLGHPVANFVDSHSNLVVPGSGWRDRNTLTTSRYRHPRQRSAVSPSHTVSRCRGLMRPLMAWLVRRHRP